MPKYVVYEQRTPTFAGRDKNDEPIFEANLVAIATIQAQHSKRFDEARKHTPFPVLEEISHANH